MSRINPLSKEISVKLVYYGPGLSGKTTTLQHIHRSIKPEKRGEMLSLATEGDRTIFFDFLPIHIDRVRGMSVRLQLYTVPGQVFYGATRKLVLNGADGVIFVADSQRAARERNDVSLEDLRENLAELGTDLARFPLVFQYNKRDLTELMSTEEMDADLNPSGRPSFGTVATEGREVFDALKAMIRLIVAELKARRRVAERPRSTETMVIEEPDSSASIEAQLAKVAERQEQPAAPNALEVSAPSVGLSFAALWPEESRPALVELENHILEHAYGQAAREAAHALANLLADLPGTTEADGPLSRALMLGLDGHEYLRLSRLASTPDEAVSETDALFALHFLVAARVCANQG